MINAEILMKKYESKDLFQMIEIWNEIVEDGTAFPQKELLNEKSAETFFSSQTYCGVCKDLNSGRLLGLYILHPNNVGRCAHISNASFAVRSSCRGRKIGRMLVTDCIEQAKAHGFKILQFNAVVKTNTAARHLYESLGFRQLGVIPKGFLMKDGHYEDICPYYYDLEE